MKITKESLNDCTIAGVAHNGKYDYYVAPRYDVKRGDDVIIEGGELGTVTKTIEMFESDYYVFVFFLGDHADLHTIDGVVQKFVYEDEAEDESNTSAR